jgi:hypothetical protein
MSDTAPRAGTPSSPQAEELASEEAPLFGDVFAVAKETLVKAMPIKGMLPDEANALTLAQADGEGSVIAEGVDVETALIAPPVPDGKDEQLVWTKVDIPLLPSYKEGDVLSLVDKKVVLPHHLPPSDPQQVKAVPTPPTVAQSVVEGRLPTEVTPTTAKVGQPIASDLAFEVPKQLDTKTDVALQSKADAPPQNSVKPQPAAQPLSLMNGQLAAMASDAKERPTVGQDKRHVDRIKAAPQLPPPAAVLQQVQPPAVAIAQALPSLHPDASEKVVRSIDADIVSGLVSNDRHTQIASNASVAAAPTGVETARHAANQIATAITNQAGKVTEIALNPEELGRVRLTITAADGAITLNVLAERPETNDLLRRHIEVLAQEFRSLGYDTISFSFGTGEQSDTGAETGSSEGANMTELNEETDPDVTAAAVSTSGLDLRL